MDGETKETKPALPTTIDISGNFDDETFLRLNAVRKNIWNGGLGGLVAGVALGTSGFYCSKFLVPQMSTYLPKIRKAYSKNNFVLVILLSGAIGSFIGATTNGKNSVVYIGDIFQKNLTGQSSYKSQLSENERSIRDSQTSQDTFARREAAIRARKEDQMRPPKSF